MILVGESMKIIVLLSESSFYQETAYNKNMFLPIPQLFPGCGQYSAVGHNMKDRLFCRFETM